MSAFGATKTAEGLKDFVKSGNFAKALKNLSEVKTKLRSVIKVSTTDLSSIITKVYSRENGLIDVEFAGTLQSCHKRIINTRNYFKYIKRCNR